MSTNLFANQLPKDAKSSARQSYFTGLFNRNPWYPNILKLNEPILSKASEVLEVKRVVESLNKIEEKEINLNNQVIESRPIQEKKPLVKKEDLVETSVAEVNSDFDAYLSSLNPNWKKEDLPGYSKFVPGALRVLFYGLSEFEEGEMESLELPPFSLVNSDQDLLGKMIGAMNLQEGSFLRCPQIKGEKALNHLLNAISFFGPQVVVSLGASSTNIVLEKKVRLSNSHGEILPKSFKLKSEKNINLEFYVSPLFHPNLLEINTSMKRTAWIDMQRVMKFLQDNTKSE